MKNVIEPTVLAEFIKNPPSNQTLKVFLDNHTEMSAASLCKILDRNLKGYYDWKHRQKSLSTSSDSGVGKLVLPLPNPKGKKYSAEDKLAIIKEYGRLGNGSKTEFLRKMGLYQSDVSKWSTLVDSAAIEVLSNRKVRKDKKADSEIENLKRENNCQEKTIAKLAALVVFQKKVSDMLVQSE